VKEHNIARGIHVDAVEKAAHDMASAAVEQLDVSCEARAKIMEGVEREAVALLQRARRNSNDRSERGLSLEKGIALAFLGQCRGIGRPTEEVLRALARAGFGIRMESVQITVSSEEPSTVRLLVNGCDRSLKIATSPRMVRVPIYLGDLLVGGVDEEEGVIEIRVTGNSSIIDVRSSYEYNRPDWQTVRVNAGRRCFYLFKVRKEAEIFASPEGVTLVRSGPLTSLQVNVEALMRRYQPSKFPITATLMDSAECLREVELRFGSLLREMIIDTRGRTPESVAASALYLADMDVFQALSDAKKGVVWSSIVRMGLVRGSYLGVRGLLLKDEVGFDESVVQEEDLRLIGMMPGEEGE
jgi:hypothetical protein